MRVASPPRAVSTLRSSRSRHRLRRAAHPLPGTSLHMQAYACLYSPHGQRAPAWTPREPAGSASSRPASRPTCSRSRKAFDEARSDRVQPGSAFGAGLREGPAVVPGARGSGPGLRRAADRRGRRTVRGVPPAAAVPSDSSLPGRSSGSVRVGSDRPAHRGDVRSAGAGGRSGHRLRSPGRGRRGPWRIEATVQRDAPKPRSNDCTIILDTCACSAVLDRPPASSHSASGSPSPASIAAPAGLHPGRKLKCTASSTVA